MKIGIVGIGVVGSACRFGFELLGHKVTVHDIKLDTKLGDILDTDAVFVCVPTPSSEDGSCDITIVSEIIKDLKKCLI